MQPHDRKRDVFELELIRGALERDMPILGICRGIQILNVARGGTIRNLRDHPELAEIHDISFRSMDAHDVEVAAGTKLARIVGTASKRVNSFHGQAADRQGRGIRVAAKSPNGVIEAIEMPQYTFVICTQWHPEVPPAQMSLFKAFIDAAREFRKRTRFSPSNRMDDVLDRR